MPNVREDLLSDDDEDEDSEIENVDTGSESVGSSEREGFGTPSEASEEAGTEDDPAPLEPTQHPKQISLSTYGNLDNDTTDDSDVESTDGYEFVHPDGSIRRVPREENDPPPTDDQTRQATAAAREYLQNRYNYQQDAFYNRILYNWDGKHPNDIKEEDLKHAVDWKKVEKRGRFEMVEGENGDVVLDLTTWEFVGFKPVRRYGSSTWIYKATGDVERDNLKQTGSPVLEDEDEDEDAAYESSPSDGDVYSEDEEMPKPRKATKSKRKSKSAKSKRKSDSDLASDDNTHIKKRTKRGPRRQPSPDLEEYATPGGDEGRNHLRL